MRIEFNHFSPQAFERLVQALCVHVLGPGVVIFGPGPDGGREATLTGEIPYPSPKSSRRWNGYIVVQAKCRERLKGNNTDVDWLCSQLKNDLEKFLDTKRNLQQPQYYILASNVGLSSVAKRGGKAKVDAVFKKYRRKIGLIDYAVWSPNELRSFLENAEDVRRAYAAWLTPSDVIAELLARLGRPNLTKLIPLALARDIRNERDVRLKDAGQESDKPIFLEDVFIDLPLKVDQANTEVTHKSSIDRDKEDQIRIVATLLERAADKLDPETVDALTTKKFREKREPLPNRIVLLGGPGQGKSTLSQFIAQISRARLLANQPSLILNPQTRDAIKPILACAAGEGLWLEGPTRFPIRLDLPTYADALNRATARSEALTLISHMASRLSRDIEVQVSSDDLREWLGQCPSLIMLDGLDEVPPTANRSEVIRSIDALWDDLHFVKADSMVVVTTRPQGYHDDLDSNYWEHWELASLPSTDALKFSQRLANVRLSDPERKAEIINEMTKATADSATNSLLASPLQVAIMFGIALLKGAVPRDRWDLFERYYILFRDREAQKPKSIIREFKHQIDTLHQEAGFLLHVAAEGAGAVNPFLTREQFTNLVTRMLRAEEFDDKRIEEISAELTRVVTDRLVLLAQRIEGRIAFDVRSLQEFMAAAQITSASSVPIVQRLRAIAQNAHWRHVFRIAASKIFSVASLSHFRNDILAICHGLDNGDFGDEGHLTRSGAKLAVDLLGDGITASMPKYNKQLVRRALAVLDLGVGADSSSLLSQLSDDNLDVFQEELAVRLRQRTTLPALAAARFCIQSLAVQQGWAERILLESWPSKPEEVLHWFSFGPLNNFPPEIQNRLRAAQSLAGPDQSVSFVRNLVVSTHRHDVKQESFLRDVAAFALMPRRYWAPFVADADLNNVVVRITLDGEPLPLAGEIASITPNKEFLVVSEVRGKGAWAALEAFGRFSEQPSKTTLADAIRHFPTIDSQSGVMWLTPWVLHSLYCDYHYGAGIPELVDECLQGNFGDFEDWKKAEDRWRRIGLSEVDFLKWNDGRYLNKNLSKVGAPYLNIHVRGESLDPKTCTQLILLSQKITSIPHRLRMVELLLFVTRGLGNDLSEKIFELTMKTYEAADSERRRSLASVMVLKFGAFSKSAEFVSLAEQLGRSNADRVVWGSADIDGIIKSILHQPDQRGLLPLLFAGYFESDRLDRIVSALPASTFIEDASDNNAIRRAVGLLRLASGNWREDDIPQLVSAVLPPEGSYFNVAALFETSRMKAHEYRDKLLRCLVLRAVETSSWSLRGMLELMAAELDARHTILANPIQVRALDLPMIS